VIHSHATRFFSCSDSSTLQSSRYGWLAAYTLSKVSY
jgi:hypothetical protein